MAFNVNDQGLSLLGVFLALTSLMITGSRPIEGTFLQNPDDVTVADVCQAHFTCMSNQTGRDLTWRKKMSPADGGVSISIGGTPFGDYTVIEDYTGGVTSTITVLNTTGMNGTLFLCEIFGIQPSEPATLTIKECSWCDDVNNNKLSQFIKMDSTSVPDPCKFERGTVDFVLDLGSTIPQEFNVTATFMISGKEIKTPETRLYNCDTKYTPLTISKIDLTPGDFTVMVTIDHPSISRNESYPIKDCPVTPGPTTTEPTEAPTTTVTDNPTITGESEKDTADDAAPTAASGEITSTASDGVANTASDDATTSASGTDGSGNNTSTGDDDGDNDNEWWIIESAVLGVVLLITIINGIVYCFCIRSAKSKAWKQPRY